MQLAEHGAVNESCPAVRRSTEGGIPRLTTLNEPPAAKQGKPDLAKFPGSRSAAKPVTDSPVTEVKVDTLRQVRVSPPLSEHRRSSEGWLLIGKSLIVEIEFQYTITDEDPVDICQMLS